MKQVPWKCFVFYNRSNAVIDLLISFFYNQTNETIPCAVIMRWGETTLILNDLGVKRFGANPLGVETTWDESPWG
jgi:hypothetical protein